MKALKGLYANPFLKSLGYLSVIILSIYSHPVLAQKKSLGVGITTPNENAALHVEAPDGDQGVIFPRLSTSQRTTLTAVLDADDDGLVVYDTDEKAMFFWNGTEWRKNDASTLTLPLSGSANSTITSFSIVETNEANDTAAMVISTVGTGAALAGTNTRSVDEPFTGAHGVYGSAVGGNNNAGVYGTNIGNGTAVMGETTTGWSSIFGYQHNPGFGWAANFEIDALSNSWASLNAHTLGLGPAAAFTVNNTVNDTAAVYVTTNGTGNAGVFKVNNTASTKSAIYAENLSVDASAITAIGANGARAIVGIAKASPDFNRWPAGITGEITGSGVNTPQWGAGVFGLATNNNGSGGTFENYNADNTAAALHAQHLGVGPGLVVRQVGPGMGGNIAEFMSDDSTGLGSGNLVASISKTGAVQASSVTAIKTFGTGTAAYFEINNPSATGNSLFATSNGSDGNAIYGQFTGTAGSAGQFVNTNPANPYPTLTVDNQGDGHGTAIILNNTSNSFNALDIAINGTGTGLSINHTGSGGNLAVFQNNDTNVARIDKNGVGYFNGGAQTGGADLAEMFEVEGPKSNYEPGDVLVISESTDRTVEKSAEANSTRVAGVYATKPGVRLTERDITESIDDLVPMGVVGVIPTKVCLENGPIKRGDLLVTSSKTGHAMKAIPVNINGVLIYPTGAILGKALENFDGAESGLIKVLVNVK